MRDIESIKEKDDESLHSDPESTSSIEKPDNLSDPENGQLALISVTGYALD